MSRRRRVPGRTDDCSDGRASSHDAEALSFVMQAGGDETVDELCDRFRDLLVDDWTVAPDTPVVCDVARLGPADLATIHALARLQLLARQSGRSIRLRGPSRVLLELIELVGLGEILRAEKNPPADV